MLRESASGGSISLPQLISGTEAVARSLGVEMYETGSLNLERYRKARGDEMPGVARKGRSGQIVNVDGVRHKGSSEAAW